MRGVVYEAAGSVAAARSRAALRWRATRTTRWMIPLELLGAPPAEHDAWLAGAVAAVGRLLA